MTSAREEAWRLLARHNWFCIPITVVRTSGGKKIRPHVAYRDDCWHPYGAEELERAWGGNERAPGLGLLLPPAHLFVIDTDSLEAERYVRGKGLSRTPTILSSRGPKWILRRGPLTVPQRAGEVAPRVDLVNLLTPLPPTASYRWAAGFTPDDVPVASPPTWLVRTVKRLAVQRREPVKITTEPIPDGSRHDALARIIGKAVRAFEPAEALIIARALNATQFVPPLEDAEVVRLVEDLASRHRSRAEATRRVQ
jgi:hypothetical protein